MTSDDKRLRETLDLLAKVMASVSDRLDTQATALDRMAEAQEQARTQLAAASPDRIAAATARSTRDTLVPELRKLVDAMEQLNGTKAVLRERLRAIERGEAHYGRWRLYPWTVVLGIPLVLVTVLALAVPRAVAQTPLTCRATGGTWWVETERLPAVCLFPQHRLDDASSS